MSEDISVDEVLTSQKVKEPPEYRMGVIPVSFDVMATLGLDIDLRGCTVQGEFADKGTFAALQRKMLLPESYTIYGIFARPYLFIWDIVVESPELPIVEFGCEPPRITPIYEVTYEAPSVRGVGMYSPPVYRLKEIKIEGGGQY